MSDLRSRDGARLFYGSRMKANDYPQKVRARAMGISPQAVSKHERGEVDALSYDQLGRLAKLDLRVALAVVDGARVECEAAALSPLTLDDLLGSLIPSLDAETVSDGAEDCEQMKLAVVLGTVAMMRDRLTLPLRRELANRLDAWVDCKLGEVDAAMDAIARARALRSKLGGE